MMKTINLDKETHEILTEYAKKKHISRSAVIRMLIVDYCAEAQ